MRDQYSLSRKPPDQSEASIHVISPCGLGLEVRKRHLHARGHNLLEAAVLALDQDPGHSVNQLLILSDLSSHVIRKNLLL